MDANRLDNSTPHPTLPEYGAEAECGMWVKSRLIVPYPAPWSGPLPETIDHPGAKSDPLWRVGFKRIVIIDGVDTGPDGQPLEHEAPIQFTCVGAPSAEAARDRFLMYIQKHWASQGIGSCRRLRDPAPVRELPDELKAELARTHQDVDHAYAVVAESAEAVRDLEDIQITHSILYNHAEGLLQDAELILDYAATAPESERVECLRLVDKHLHRAFWPLVHAAEALEARRETLPEPKEGAREHRRGVRGRMTGEA